MFGIGGGKHPAAAVLPTEEEPAESSPSEPVDFYTNHKGDCAHMVGGRDEHVVTPGKIRCKDCAKADKAKDDAEQRAAARAEIATVVEVPR